MPSDHTDAERKLKKLGERLRDGWAKQNPLPQQSIDTVRQTVREEWQREQAMKREKRPPAPSKSRDRQPPEPER